MRRAAMSKRAEALTIRLARPDERDALEELQRRASLALPNYREQLEAHPDATLEEHCARWAQARGARVSTAMLSRVIAGHFGWTRKKRP